MFDMSSSAVRYLWACGTEVDCCCVCDPREWGVLCQKLCQSIFSYMQHISVYALSTLALCLHCHQCELPLYA